MPTILNGPFACYWTKVQYATVQSSVIEDLAPNYLCYKGQTTPALDELFNGEAPRRLETAVQLLKSDNRKTLLRAVLIFMIAWTPRVLRNLILSRRWAAVIIAVLLLLPPVLLYEIPLNVIVPDLMKLLL